MTGRVFGGRVGLTNPAIVRLCERVARAEYDTVVVCGPAGTGRHEFARTWAGERVIEAGNDAEAVVRLLGDQRTDGERRCVVTGSSRVAREIAEKVPCLPLGPTALLLRRDEVHTLVASARRDADAGRRDGAGTDEDSAAPSPDTIYRLTGGWLRAVELLAETPESELEAESAIDAALVPWLLDSEVRRSVGWLSQLSVVSERILDGVAHESGVPVLTLGQLEMLGLCRPLDGGGWFVPELVRRALARHEWMFSDPDAAVEADAVVVALARAGRIDDAVAVARRRRSWRGLRAFLSDEWVDGFTSNPCGFVRMVTALPRTLKEGLDGYAVAMRVMLAVGRDGMRLPLPTVEPDYAQDATAQRLAERRRVLRRHPNGRAVTVGLLEIAHLRLVGLYAEAADASAELRETLADAVGAHRVRPSLAALAELQLGISLQLMERTREATLAYEAAYYWARVAGNDFVEANAAANLALSAAVGGDSANVTRRLRQYEAAVENVGWGRGMVARAAELARGWQAVWAVDLAGVDVVLARLPCEPDHNEFWAGHLWLQVYSDVLHGDPGGARARIVRARDERVYAARSEFSRHYLNRAAALVDVVDEGRILEVEGALWPEIGILKATAEVARGDVDRALSLVSGVLAEAAYPRLYKPAWFLREYLRADRRVGASLQAAVRAAPVRSETLADLVPLHMLGATGALRAAGLITTRQRLRLEHMPHAVFGTGNRPELTAREREVLDLLRRGFTRGEMARALYRSPNTIKAQLRSLYRKLGASTAEEALTIARRAGY